MSKFKTVAKSKAVKASLPSNSKDATVNRAGGVAFEINDAAVKLVTMTGGAFFAEPKYYNADTCIPKRGVGGKFDKLAERIAVADGKLKDVASCDELDQTAREVVATAVDVIKGKSPEDILAIANWLRNEQFIRLTPQVLLVLASRFDNTKSLVRKYAVKIVQRPDEVKTCLMVHRFLFGMKSLSNGLAMGLADSVGKFGERGLMKYDGDDFPRWKDVLCWLPRKAGWPLSNEVAKYFVTGAVVDPAKTPVIAARKELAKMKKFDDKAKELAKASYVNWEVLLSQFGEDKKAVWEFLIESNLLGYMALMRNVRNILEAKVGRETIRKVAAKLSDKDEVVKSKQLPFRFLSAKKALEGISGECDNADLTEIMTAIEQASDAACANVPKLSGVTVVFADNSGSMDSPVSEKSKISCKDAANVLCGIVAKVADRGYVCAFGSDVGPVRYSKTDTVLGIAQKADDADIKGYSTNGHRCIEWMMQNNIVPDRVIFLSDMQMWDSGGWGGEGNVADAWAKFLKSTPKAKDTWLHTVHLNGYGDSAVKEGKRVNLVAGFSEKMLSMLLEAEGVAADSEEVKPVPTLDQIREKWSVK